MFKNYMLAAKKMAMNCDPYRKNSKCNSTNVPQSLHLISKSRPRPGTYLAEICYNFKFIS